MHETCNPTASSVTFVRLISNRKLVNQSANVTFDYKALEGNEEKRNILYETNESDSEEDGYGFQFDNTVMRKNCFGFAREFIRK